MRSLLIALAVIVAIHGPAAAQDTVAVLRAMESRLDSMEAARQARAEDTRKASTADTVAVGGLRIATSAKYRSLAQEAAGLAWDRLLDRFGPQVLSRTQLPVQPLGTADGPPPAPGAVGEWAAGFERSAILAVWHAQASAVGPWLHGGFPSGDLTSDALAGLATELATLPGRGNAGCLDGLARKCLAMLGLGLGPDTLAEWYAPDTWPRLAAMIGSYLPPAEQVVRAACTGEGYSDACRALLTPERLRPPISVQGRLLFLQLALEAGGSGSFERLTEDGTVTLEARLARAAGLPADTLAVRWAAAVRAAAPPGPAHPPHALAVALGWSTCLLALALRGSRWR